MKAKPGFKLMEVCGSYMIVAEGKENINFSNIIQMNESSKLLWESIQGKDFTADDLAHTLMENYQLDDNTPLSYATALHDATELVDQWLAQGIIE